MDLGMNSRRRTRSNDNLGSRAITTTSLASSMLLASQDAASSARHSRASETAFMASHRLHLEVQKPSGSGRYSASASGLQRSGRRLLQRGCWGCARCDGVGPHPHGRSVRLVRTPRCVTR